MTGTWKKKEKAHEDEYFEKIERERLQKLAQVKKAQAESEEKKRSESPSKPESK